MEQLDHLLDKLSKMAEGLQRMQKNEALPKSYCPLWPPEQLSNFLTMVAYVSTYSPKTRNLKIYMLSHISIALSATSLSSIHLAAQNDFRNKLLPVTLI